MSSSPTVLVVQHSDDCTVGWFGPWLEGAGCVLDCRRPYAGDPLPADLTGHDGLLVLGGPQNANADEIAPWLPATRALLRAAGESATPALGICLGHQLCAVAYGGVVERNPRGQQLGLLDVGWLPARDGDELVGGLVGRRRGVQWNDDIVTTLPSDAVLLAATPEGDPQAVRWAPTVWGVQLHPEVDAGILAGWASEESDRYDDDRLDRAVAAAAEAEDELRAAWRPLAERFGAIVRERARA